MARGGAEVPHPRLAGAREQRPARELVARPLADHGARDVADVVLVEDEQRAQSRFGERVARAGEPIIMQPPEIDPLLEIHLHAPRRLQRTVPAVAGIGRVVEAVGSGAPRALWI